MGGVLNEGIDSMPVGWRIWVYWMVLVNMGSIVFLRRQEGRVILGVWFANVVTMTLMAEQWGYVRLLGLAHILWWVPLTIYLSARWKSMERGSALRRYAAVLMATIGLSLALDFVDVGRYLAGERSDLRPVAGAAEAP